MLPVQGARRSARERPDDPAVVSVNTILSWGELTDTAARLATLFERRGVQPGHIVAFEGFSQILQAVLTMAVWYRAAIACAPPTNFVNQPPFAIDWVLTPQPLAGVAGQIVLDTDQFQQLGSFPVATPVRYASPSELCRLMFSSGTTGQQKAIPFSVELLESRIASARTDWMPPRPFVSLLGIRTISGFQTFAEAMSSGEPYFIAETAADALQILQHWRIRSMKGSPTQLAVLAESLATIKLPELVTIQSTGASMPNQLRERLHELTGAAVVNVYGSSEVGAVAIGRPSDSDTGYAGEIVPGIDVEIVDDTGTALAEGQTGRLRVRRAHQPDGYFADEYASADSFVDGWFFPGDLAQRRGSHLFVFGRESEVMNAGGAKVLPSEVERVLLRYPGVEDAAAFTAPDQFGNERIHVAIVATQSLDMKALAAFVAPQIEHAAPSSYHQVEQIPRNPNGKIVRAELVPLLG
ncbi:MAG: class I adenylate-forming enzyme family protein [Microbacteriaceae bacterium]